LGCSSLPSAAIADCTGWLLPLPVGGALDDDLERRALQAVDRRLCEQSIGHHGNHLIWGPVAGDNRADLPVPFDDEIVEIGGLSGFKPAAADKPGSVADITVGTRCPPAMATPRAASA
jgi:hypothetical protein